MSDLAYEVYDRAEYLGATEKGFCKWFRLEFGQDISEKDWSFPTIKETFWEEYLDTLEETARYLSKWI